MAVAIDLLVSLNCLWNCSWLTTEKHGIVAEADIWVHTKTARSRGGAPLTAPGGHGVQTKREWNEKGAWQSPGSPNAIKWI